MLKNILHKIKRRILWRSLMFVIIDPSDSSVTFSKELFEHIKEYAEDKDRASAFMFKTTEGCFAFSINPDASEFPVSNIQYNGEHKCVGFETLNPTVGRILFDYKLPAMLPVKLTVKYRKINKHLAIYQLEKPDKYD